MPLGHLGLDRRGGPKAGSANKKGDSAAAPAAVRGGGGGGTPTIDADTNGDGKVTEAEKAAAGKTDLALKQDEKRKDTEGTLGDRKTDPTKVGAIDASQTSNGIPAPVIASIAALALLAAAAALFFLGTPQARLRPGHAPCPGSGLPPPLAPRSRSPSRRSRSEQPAAPR